MQKASVDGPLKWNCSKNLLVGRSEARERTGHLPSSVGLRHWFLVQQREHGDQTQHNDITSHTKIYCNCCIMWQLNFIDLLCTFISGWPQREDLLHLIYLTPWRWKITSVYLCPIENGFTLWRYLSVRDLLWNLHISGHLKTEIGNRGLHGISGCSLCLQHHIRHVARVFVRKSTGGRNIRQTLGMTYSSTVWEQQEKLCRTEEQQKL